MSPRATPLVLLLAVPLLACGAGKSSKRRAAELAAISAATPADVDPATLHRMYRLDSDFTDVQRDEKEKQIEGKVVQWTGMSVYEVSKSGRCYRITTEPGASSFPGSTIKACPPDGISDALAQWLETNSMIAVKGKIDGVFLRSIQIEPAIVTAFQQ